MVRSILTIGLALFLTFSGTVLAAPGRAGMHPTKAGAPPTGTLLNAVAALRTPPTIIQQSMSRAYSPAFTAGFPGGTLGQIMRGSTISIPAVQGTVPKAMEVTWNSIAGIPRSIRVENGSSAKSPATLAMHDPVASANKFLADNSPLLRISNPAAEFSLVSAAIDKQGMSHFRYQQMYAGIEVWASDVYVHTDALGQVTSFNGTYHPTPAGLSTTAAVPAARALEIVNGDLASHNDARTLTASLARILNDNGPATKQVIWHDQAGLAHLAWFVEERTRLDRDWYYFIDAQTGSILNAYNAVTNDGPATGTANDLNGVQRTFGTYLSNSEYFMVDASQPMFNATGSSIPQNPVGAIVGLDLRNQDLSAQATIYFVTSSNNTWADPASVSSQYNAAVVYNFFRTVYGRNSIDDKGMTIYSIVHVTSNGEPMDNAFWSGTVMCYGDGNTDFKPLAGGFDVAAHEMTHGVTQHTANLVYQNQSGALNESMSDVFASVVDSANWTIGEQVIKDFTAFPSGALRDMSNPHNGGTQGSAAWQPASMTEFVETTGDNGGVHVNSGIPNNVFYRVATALGRPTAGAIWYKALTSYVTSAAQFVDARIATESAASDLYGAGSAQVTAVKNAWDAVGVTEGTPTPPPPPSQVEGTGWVLAVNTDSNDPNSIYRIAPVITSQSDFTPLSTTPVLTKPAVSDTSGLVVFVGTDFRLRALSANGGSPSEQELDTNSVWWSVAIGPGLSSLALTSRFVDTTIYYINFVSKTTQQFKIRGTAYDGTPVATALYSDALSFDPTGRYILFDAFNQTRSAQGDTIHFWTINLLDVQTGQVHSVFPPQAEGIDVGNPSFSRTRSNRFVFDYLDEKNVIGQVMGADFFTGKAGVIEGSLPDVGYPTLSGDGMTIAYHTIVSQGGTDHHVIRQIGVDTAGIAPSGSPSDYVVDATFPFWFTIGTRVTGVQEQPAGTTPEGFALEQNYPNPFNPSTTIQYTVGGVRSQASGASDVRLVVYDVLGREVAVLVNEKQVNGTYQVKFNGDKLSSGVYYYRLTAGESSATKEMIFVK